MSDALGSFNAAAPHPLQRAWDKMLLNAWAKEQHLDKLLDDFAKAHNNGNAVTKDSGLKRLPAQGQYQEIPVRAWVRAF